MRERKKGKQSKKDSKLIYKIIIPVLLVVSILIVGISVVGFNPYAEFGDEYIFANDLVKNFNIDSFDGDPVSVSGVTSDRKMKFEIQAAWTLDKDDVVVVDNYLADNETLILRYKIAVKTKFNAFTTLTLMQCAGRFDQILGSYFAAHYEHDPILQINDVQTWDAYLNWTYYDFGDIKIHNEQNNYFDGDVEMSFDIAQNLLPNSIIVSDDSLTKNFDYIAVSSAGVISSDIGKLSDVDLGIISIVPEDETLELEEYSSDIKTEDTAIAITWNINPKLDIDDEASNTAGGGIIPQSDGSSLNPRNKDGSAIWDVVNEQVSMNDCKLLYNIGHLSPHVEEYYGTLSYTEMTVKTSTNLRRQTTADITVLTKSYTNPVALHVSNRYIQSEIQVVFDVYTSYNIVVAETDIEDYELAFPQEFYDLVAWLTAVEGIGGGKTYTEAPEGLFSMNDLILIIIIIVVVIIGIYIFYKVVSPMIKESQQRKTLETAMGMGMRR